MADLFDTIDFRSHVGPGCIHDKERRVRATYAKWLTKPETQTALMDLASMMDCACGDVKTKEDLAKLVKVGETLKVFTAEDAVSLFTVMRAEVR